MEDEDPFECGAFGDLAKALAVAAGPIFIFLVCLTDESIRTTHAEEAAQNPPQTLDAGPPFQTCGSCFFVHL